MGWSVSFRIKISFHYFISELSISPGKLERHFVLKCKLDFGRQFVLGFPNQYNASSQQAGNVDHIGAWKSTFWILNFHFLCRICTICWLCSASFPLQSTVLFGSRKSPKVTQLKAVTTYFIPSEMLHLCFSEIRNVSEVFGNQLFLKAFG